MNEPKYCLFTLLCGSLACASPLSGPPEPTANAGAPREERQPDPAADANAPHEERPPDTFAHLKEKARRIAMPLCGKCHGDAERAGKPEALAIFDLRRADWFETLDAEQLEAALGRMEGNAEDEDLALFSRFIWAAIARLEPAPAGS